MGVKLSGRTTVSPSWPGLSRPSTSSGTAAKYGVDGRDKPGHDGEAAISLLNLTPMGLRPLLRRASIAAMEEGRRWI